MLGIILRNRGICTFTFERDSTYSFTDW